MFIGSGSQVKTKRKIIVVTPKFDQSGSAIFLYGVIKDFKKFHPEQDLIVLAESFDDSAIDLLKKLDIKYTKFSPDQDNELFMSSLNLSSDDHIFLNSIALQPNIRDYFLKYLLDNKINKIHWYIHEDMPEIQLADKFFHEKFIKACQNNKLFLYTPSQQVAKNYSEFLDYNVVCKPYRLEIPGDLMVNRDENEFNKLKFVVVGNANDGRKGQIAILAAFQIFYWEIYNVNKEKYRDFELTMVGLHDDFVTQNLRDIANYKLSQKINLQGRMERSMVLEIIKKSNITITYSYMEALPISTFEGMVAGHPIIRNKVAGFAEQFNNNGVAVENMNLESLINALEIVLNEEKTSNSKLLEYSKNSNKLTTSYTKNIYDFFK
jgi:glycosyltransferase involved in cell wall biosynthesis